MQNENYENLMQVEDWTQYQFDSSIFPEYHLCDYVC